MAPAAPLVHSHHGPRHAAPSAGSGTRRMSITALTSSALTPREARVAHSGWPCASKGRIGAGLEWHHRAGQDGGEHEQGRRIVAPALVEGTDLVLTVARRIVPAGGLDAALAVFAPPFAIAPFAFRQLWHRRREDDPAHRWLRERIAALAGGPDQPPMRKVSAVSE